MLEDYSMSNICSESDNSSVHYPSVHLSSPVLHGYQEHDHLSPHQVTFHHNQSHQLQQPQLYQPQQPQQQHPQQPQQQHPQQPQQQQPQHGNNASPVIVPVNQRRLPVPCPVPYNCFSQDVVQAIDNNQITGIFKIRLIRQAASFYCGICPKPTHEEYMTMARTLCDRYAQLKDKKPTNNPAKKFFYYVSQP